jgi:DNA-binding LytR/AlgR family response regulator
MAEDPSLKMQAIAVDDEPPALRVIERFCASAPEVTLAQTFTKPSEALAYLASHPVDLLFLDIQMPGLSGLDFRKSVAPETMVIFTTAHSEFAVEGFNLEAIDYLLKPFTLARFQQAVARAAKFFALERDAGVPAPHFIFLRADYNLHKINLDDVLLVEGLDDYLKVHLAGQKTLVVRMTMKAMLEKLPAAGFVRVHRSYIIPMKRVEQLRSKSVVVAGREVPLGGTYERAFLDLIGG